MRYSLVLVQNKQMFRFYFKLSAEAPELWEEIFEETRKFPRHSLWWTSRAEGEHIILECPPSELVMHKTDLDIDVANTNAVYHKHLAQTEKQATKAAENPNDVRSILRGLRRQLFGDQ